MPGRTTSAQRGLANIPVSVCWGAALLLSVLPSAHQSILRRPLMLATSLELFQGKRFLCPPSFRMVSLLLNTATSSGF